MKIERLRIDRYGPLGDFQYERRRDMTVFYGPNEWGKTLIIDALLKLLYKTGIKRHKKYFGNLDRVKDPPEGYIEIEAGGRPHKLGRADSVSTLYPVDVSPLDFRNVFMIRDSDLSIGDESDYFTEVTRKLTGLRTDEIQRLMTAVRKRGCLTSTRPDAPLSDSEEFGKVAGRVEQAAALAAHTAGLRERFLEDRFDLMERDLSRARHSLAETGRRLEEQKQAGRRQTVEKASGALDQLRAIDNELAGMDAITDRERDAWQKAEWELVRLDRARAEDGERLIDVRAKLEAGRKTQAELNARIKLAEEKKQTIDFKLEPQIEQCRRRQDKITRTAAREGADKLGLSISLIIFLLSLAVSFFTPSYIFWLAAGLGLSGTIIFGYRVLSLYNLRGLAEQSFEALYLDASERGLDSGGSLKELLRAIDRLDQDLKTQRQRAAQAEQDNRALEGEEQRLENRQSEHGDAAIRTNQAIEAFKTASGAGSLEEFKSVLAGKQEREKDKASLEAVLASLLDTGASAASSIDAWADIIERRRRELPVSKAIEYDPGQVQELEKRAAVLRQDIEQLSGRQQAAHEDISGLRSRLAALNLPVQPPDELNSTAALEALEGRLNQYAADIRAQADRARAGLRILHRLADEEKGRVSRLFGEDMRVSEYFSRFTGRRYRQVSFDTDQSKLFVHPQSGAPMEAGRLSGGAFDQLYMAVRLAVGERLLQGETGFFVLDDPFIKSDITRLEEQLRNLLALAGDGWQILYFTAKDEVRDMTARLADAERAEIIDLNSQVSLEPS